MTKKESVHKTIVFADGASSGNPGPSGWGAIIATPDGKVIELGGGDPASTNNRMELMAVIRALEALEASAEPIAIHTDSVYVIRGITQWIWGWRKNGWKTAEGGEVVNQDLWKILSGLLAKRREKHGDKMDVKWHFVRGHSGIPGNERVDEIAVAFSKGRPISLFRGPLLSYSVPIHDLPEEMEPLPSPRPREEKKPPAYSYLSLIGSIPMRHRDWTSCERRVKGRSGARFKKAMSASEEETILKSWGFSAKDVREDGQNSG